MPCGVCAGVEVAVTATTAIASRRLRAEVSPFIMPRILLNTPVQVLISFDTERCHEVPAEPGLLSEAFGWLRHSDSFSRE